MVTINYGIFTSGQTDYIETLNENFATSKNYLEYHDQEIAIIKAAVTPGLDLDYRHLTQNLLINGAFDFWQRGITTRPDCWKQENTGVGFAVSQTSTKYLNTYSVLMQNQGQLTQALDTEFIASLAETTPLTFGCWVKSAYASKARIGVYNGLVTSWSSSYHSGGNDWEFMTVTLLATSSLTEIKFILDSGTLSNNYFNAAVVIKGNPYADPLFIYNDKVLEELRVLSNIEVNKSSLKGVGFLSSGDRELISRVNFMAPKKSIPLISFIDDAITGYDVLYNNVTRYGFDLHVIDIGGSSGTDGFEYLDINWKAEIAE